MITKETEKNWDEVTLSEFNVEFLYRQLSEENQPQGQDF